MDETKQLAHFITDIEYNDFSSEVIDKAKGLILEQLGCQLAFAKLPWSRAVFDYILSRKSDKEESTVVNYGLKTTVDDAAFANAVFNHGFEMDDDEPNSVSHPGCVVIPPSLAIAEKRMINGKEFLTSVVVGYDVMIRIGCAARPLINRGFHGTPVVGTFGAVSAASKVLHLDEYTVQNALGIAASNTGGIAEYTISGGSVKRLHAGFAAQGGIRAAFLAMHGMTAPATALEGEKGFCQAFADDYSLNKITDGLGREYRILWVGNKAYCCCAAQHSTIDAVSKIVGEHTFKLDDIEEITVGQISQDVKAVGNIIEPEDITGAQFSGRFGVALRLIKKGNGFRDYSMENIRDPEIISLAKKVKYFVDPELEEVPLDSIPSKVAIRLKDGTIYRERVDYAKGFIQNPMTRDELEGKFRDLASKVLSDTKMRKIIRTVDHLEDLENVNELASLLVADKN